jgi:hypothetical protein
MAKLDATQEKAAADKKGRNEGRYESLARRNPLSAV